MLSDRERRTLAIIERHLVESDPELAMLFAGCAPRSPGGAIPTVLLVTGLLLMITGSMLVAAPMAITGMAMSIVALCLAYARPTGLGRTSSA
jgi:hypothetical protein